MMKFSTLNQNRRRTGEMTADPLKIDTIHNAPSRFRFPFPVSRFVCAALCVAMCALPLLTRPAYSVPLADTHQSDNLPQDIEADSESATASQAPFAVYRNRGMAALQARQYERAREQFTVALELNPQDAISLYQLGVVELNLGHVVEGQMKLKQAHMALSSLKERPEIADTAELYSEGKYNFVPRSKDGWRLQLKNYPTIPNPPTQIYHLDTDSVYSFELSRREPEDETPSRSRYLISIPIGLLLVWVFAR